ADPGGGGAGKLLGPARRRACIEHIRGVLSISERRACAALGQHRSTQRKIPRGREDEERLTADIVALARRYGRYGYRKIAELLRRAGWLINDKRVERIWRREGLKVPVRQPKRARLWLNDGSCIRLRAERRHEHLRGRSAVADRGMRPDGVVVPSPTLMTISASRDASAAVLRWQSNQRGRVADGRSGFTISVRDWFNSLASGDHWPEDRHGVIFCTSGAWLGVVESCGWFMPRR